MQYLEIPIHAQYANNRTSENDVGALLISMAEVGLATDDPGRWVKIVIGDRAWSGFVSGEHLETLAGLLRDHDALDALYEGCPRTEAR